MTSGTKPAIDAVIAELARTRPAFHRSAQGEATDWGVLPGTLSLIATHIRDGARTLETGAGASSVVFAASGAFHTVISPIADEHQAVCAWCMERGIATDRLVFKAESSAEGDALRRSAELDVVFLDGRHSFPAPMVDWHYAANALRVGGVMILDDVPIPSVGLLHRFMSDDAGWAVLGGADNRAVAYRKLAEMNEGDAWRDQRFNRKWPDYSYLPLGPRISAAAAWKSRLARAALMKRMPASVQVIVRRVRRR